MDTSEMKDLLERIARDENVAPSARVRAVETLMRLAKQTPEDSEWELIVREFGEAAHAE